MSHPSTETTRLIHTYEKTLGDECGVYTSILLLALCVGEPNSRVRAAFTAMLASLDADYTKWSANETYREAMMKD
jgi:hypothetical protein